MTHTIFEAADDSTWEIGYEWVHIAVKCPNDHRFVVGALETNIECPVEGCGWYISVKAKVNMSIIWFGTVKTALSYGERYAPKGEIIGPDASEARPSVGERSRAEPHRERADDGGTGLDSSP